MSFKVVERNGNWGVFQDSGDSRVAGTEIDYEMYRRLRDKPHEASKHFERGHKGRLSLRKDKPRR